MGRKLIACRARTAVLLSLALPLGLLAAGAGAEPRSGQPPADSASGESRLPLSQVALFSSGVGYFQRDGRVEGDARLELEFRAAEVNDLLKSLVLRDFDGGTVRAVTYTSRDPLTRSLQSFAIDLTRNPGLAEILTQVRGESVEIFAPDAIRGTVVGVESRQLEEKLTAPFLDLLTDRGLRSIRLDQVVELRLLNPKLDEELRQALDLLAQGRRDDRKRVALSFTGRGSRRVQVAYIRETPVWKTSYRLSIPAEGPPYLQGWAIAENTTDEDWREVHLSLIAGRPISFTMDLYQPLYLPRPQVRLELEAGLAPQTYEDDLSAAGAPPIAEETFSAPSASRAAAAPPARQRAGAMQKEMAAPEELDLSAGVRSAAQAARAGEFFQYRIEGPVTIPRRESAMLPIVGQPIEGQRVSIYNPAVHAVHPLNGLQLKNTTGLSLMAGPLTVFEGGIYAGDSRIDFLPAQGERLISYSLDLETEAAPESRSLPETLAAVRITRGTLISTVKLRRETVYTLRNKGDRDKRLLVEQPLDPDWQLVEPARPQERTRSLYRFAVALKRGGTAGDRATLKVAEERRVSQTVALTNLPDDRIVFFLQAREVEPGVKAALRRIQEMKSTLADTVRRRQEEERRIQAIHQEQARIRENMSRLERTSPLYQRYVTQLNAQEDELAALQDMVEKIRQTEAIRQGELDAYLLSLEIGQS